MPNSTNDIKIRKGSILVYRVFDLGEEIVLSEVERILTENKETGVSRFSLVRDTRKAIVVREAPLAIQLGEVCFTLNNVQHKASVIGKIWNYGSLSVSFQIPIADGTPWSELVLLAAAIETSHEIDEVAQKVAQKVSQKISPAIKNGKLWNIFEDYVIYFLENIDGVEKNKAASIIEKTNFANLIMAEPKETISDIAKKSILDNMRQYSQDDLALIDWNSALVYEPQGQKDIAEVIEFSLTHLLEMRFYDDLLDKQLSTLYDSIQNKKGILSNTYSQISEKSSSRYIEFTEFLERIDNSLKTVGDFYLANIFRTASYRFRFEDWKKSMDRKMQSLAQISELLQGEVNSRRSHYTEMVVIGLIFLEVLIAGIQHLAKTHS